MSEIKHTPLSGPWELVETHQEGILNSWHIQIGEDQVPVFPYKRIYSTDRTQSGFVTDHDRMAAFRVAATAPELLEVLIAVVSVADRSTVEFDKARAAIAKARGAL